MGHDHRQEWKKKKKMLWVKMLWVKFLNSWAKSLTWVLIESFNLAVYSWSVWRYRSLISRVFPVLVELYKNLAFWSVTPPIATPSPGPITILIPRSKILHGLDSVLDPFNNTCLVLQAILPDQPLKMVQIIWVILCKDNFHVDFAWKKGSW